MRLIFQWIVLVVFKTYLFAMLANMDVTKNLYSSFDQIIIIKTVYKSSNIINIRNRINESY